MNTLLEALRELSMLNESAKTDFIDKFGQNLFDKFEKAKQRMKNKNLSVDYQQYLKMSTEELTDFLLSLYDDKKDAQKKRVISGTDKEIRGEYKYLGEKGGYKIYQPLDVQASMDLGVNTGWCTTGRYGHYGHPEFTPSYKDAKEHWDDYKKKNAQLFYFLNPKTMYGEYAIAIYPKKLSLEGGDGFKLLPNCKVKKANFEIFDDRDNLDYSKFKDLPKDMLPELILDYLDGSETQGWIIQGNILKGYAGDEKNVIIPDGVKKIGDGAFEERSGLISVTIPDSVTSIGNKAFLFCKDLVSVTVGKGVTSIGSQAFHFCSRLSSISIPEGVTNIGNGAFNNCSSLTSINIPDNVTSIGDFMFSYCSSLKSITIPDSVTSIGDYAFAYCNSLTSITIPDSVTFIGKDAFTNCKELKIIHYAGMIRDWNKVQLRKPLTNSYSEDKDKKFLFKCKEKDPNGGDIILYPDGDLVSSVSGEVLAIPQHIA